MGAKKGYSSEGIIRKLRQAEVMLHEGKTITETCRTLGVSDSTYYKWRQEYGGMRIDQAKRLKELEKENSRLKKAVADLTVDKLILQEVARGK
jgi:transposase-like protein